MLTDGFNMLAQILLTLTVIFGVDHIGVGVQ